MRSHHALPLLSLLVVIGPAGCGGSNGSHHSGSGTFTITPLVSDLPGAPHQDANLKNPWGISLGPNSTLWVSDNGTDKTTLYSGDVNGSPLVVNPLIVDIPGGTPTGQVFNSTNDFAVTSGAQTQPAVFIFASESGSITGWNPAVPLPVPSTSAQTGVTVPTAVFKGLALGSSGGQNFLYATDFHNHRVRVFDRTYTETNLAGTFADPNIPTDFAPFGIANIGGDLFVTYAQKETGGDDDVKGSGKGFVDRFRTDGTLIGRFVTRGPLNAPWGIVKAPAGFGEFGGAILVGNFGDGKINAFDSTTGKLLGTLGNGGKALVQPGLWGLAFGNGTNAGDTNALYFTAGINDEADGMFGKITSS